MGVMIEIVQDLCGRQNLDVPTTVIGTTDPQVRQIMKLLEEEGNDLAARGGWERLTIEAVHTTVASEDQGAIASIASTAFRYIKNQTFWDRDTKLPICGP